MTRFVVLLRGVNVGPAKRIAMADFAGIISSVGGRDVKTILNSGNAVFSAKASADALAKKIRGAITEVCGFDTNTWVIPASDLDAVIDDDPIAEGATDHSRYIVAFVMDGKVLTAAKTIARDVKAPERMVVTRRAVYCWCPGGLLSSEAVAAFMKAGKDQNTMRNWATLLKIQAAARG